MKKYKCNKCTESFNKYYYFLNHLKIVHKMSDSNILDNKNNNGYQNVFLKCEIIHNSKKNINYNNFRNLEEFKFLINSDPNPDKESIDIAKKISNDYFNKYIQVEKKKYGYGNKLYKYSKCDNLDSRHIMMSCFIFSNLKQKLNKIIEIGGGFGNWYRLNQSIVDFNKWIIIDIPHVNKLQKWYLNKVNLNSDKLELINTNNFDQHIEKFNICDLVIGAHSLSEISYKNFMNYFNKILVNTKYFFYSYHKYCPSKELIQKKNEIINKFFKTINMIESENNNVVNILFINNKY